MDPGAFAELGQKYGGWFVAALAVWWGTLERKERRDVQGKLDKYSDKLPEKLSEMVSESRLAIADFTSKAEQVLRLVQGGG